MINYLGSIPYIDRIKLNGPTSPVYVASNPHTKYNNAPAKESIILFNPFFLLSEYILYQNTKNENNKNTNNPNKILPVFNKILFIYK